MGPPRFVLNIVAKYYEARQARAHRNAEKIQKRLLSRILRRYADTELGRHLELAEVRTAEEFARRVPLSTAADYQTWWERALETNPPNLVHPGRLRYMARSSGTSGARKYIPLPQEQIDSFKTFSNHGFFHAFHELKDYSLLESNILVTSALGLEHHAASGITLGYASGLATLNATRFGRRLIRPTSDIIDIRDWQEKIHRTVEQTWNLDIRIATGPPLPFLALVEHLLEYARNQGRDVRTVRDIWPNLRMYAYSGASIHTLEHKLRALLGSDVVIFEIYSSTEAPVAYQYKPGQPGMLVDLLTTYFEFEPVDPEAKARLGRRIAIHEVQTGVPYEIAVTSVGGVFAYKLGDVVEFLSTSPYVIRFAGRNKEEINLNTEHLRVDQAVGALRAACESTGAEYEQFFVCPQDILQSGDKGNLGYEFFVEFSRPPDDEGVFLTTLDDTLKTSNDLYGFYRNGSIFRFPSLTRLPAGTIAQYARLHLEFGQAKFLNLHGDRQILEKILAVSAQR